MRTNELSFMLGGHAGQGAKTVGDAFARMCTRAGLHVFINMEYPSNIKGEHNYIQVMVSENEMRSHDRPIDLLLALDAKTVLLHKDEILPNGALIYDRQGLEISPVDVGIGDVNIERKDILVVDIPLLKIAKDIGGSERMLNATGLGAVQGLLRFDFEELAAILRESLAKLGEEKVEKNLACAKRAYDLVRESFADKFAITLARRDAPRRMLLTGNEALAMGALKAGVKFYTSYPMTPSSSILTFMARHAREYGLIAQLTEDEISAIGMAVGAAFAGVRAMCGTSGGGFCLMCEHLGLAGIAEIPLVIVEGQRPGPATGLPTRTEQADLRFVLSAHQGDFPRIVIAPGDPGEAFRLCFDAFNLADRYQTPVIVLTDKHLAESSWTCEPFDTRGMEIDRGERLGEQELSALGGYKRYLVTESGISPLSRPGLAGGVFRASGNEHDLYGRPSEDANNRTQQMDKRLRKLDSLDVSQIGAQLHGDPDADLTLIGWGSTKPVILETMSLLKERQGLNCNFLQVIYMSPFPTERVTEIMNNAKRTIALENNATGQLAGLIREHTGCEIQDKILKYNGRQFFRDELADLVVQHL